MRNINKLISAWKSNNQQHRKSNRRLAKTSKGRLDAMTYQVWGKFEEVKTKLGKLLEQVFPAVSPKKALQLQPVEKRKTRKSIVLMALSGLMATAFFSGCDMPDKKGDDTQVLVADSMKTSQVQADEPYLTDMKNYRKDIAQKLEEYNKDILALKSEMKMQKQESQTDYQNSITVLEQKCSALKMKMDNYQENGKDKWEVFKTELDEEMDQMSKALNDSSALKEL